MLKKLTHRSLLALSLAIAATLHPAYAASEPVGYEIVSPAQPTHDVNKIEVIEFFWYGCPHCFDFEPTLAKWLKTMPKNVEFIRNPLCLAIYGVSMQRLITLLKPWAWSIKFMLIFSPLCR